MPFRFSWFTLCFTVFASGLLSTGPAFAQNPKAEWWSSLNACNLDNRSACDKAVTMAAALFERTDREVATTWMKTCMAGDVDRCEIGYRRFSNTSFTENGRPISHMFARISCFAGMADLCRPWDDFETTNESSKALVMADVCLQGALPGTCKRALGYFRHNEGLYNPITHDLSKTLCERYDSGSACRVYAEVLEANWSHYRAYEFHIKACRKGLQASCPDVARLKKRVRYENDQRQAAEDAKMKREAAEARAVSWRSQLQSNDYTSPGWVRTPTTPFGSTSRDIRNWDNYQENLRCSNPTASGC